MSGHNKWSKIKRKKAAADKEKGRVYSRHIKAISDAAKNNPNPGSNANLKRAVEQAKENNVPKSKIENALKKAQELAKNAEVIKIEAYGPAGIALLIIAQTDKQARTIQEIKSILNDSPEGKWADPGSVLWAFKKPAGPGEEWQPKFPQKISKEDREKLDSLVEKIRENKDVKKIYTSAL